MADPQKPDDLTLPGTLSGLLRRGSPVLAIVGWLDEEDQPKPYRCVVAELMFGHARLHLPERYWSDVQDADEDAHDDEQDTWHFDWLHLDLTDKTGRVHAAWWALARLTDALTNDAWRAETDAILTALHGLDMTDTQIAALRDLCLRLAGGSDDR